jgi:coproporphyrinogen III oxidase
MTPDEADTHTFHAALEATCNAHDGTYYEKFKKWCDEYFYLPHRSEPRGVGGIFYDYLDTADFERDFAFTRAVGETFLNTYPKIVRRHLNEPWTPAEREHQLVRRGRYVEFNLLHDRGTKFGLMTGGNTEAILMSLPPEVKWP